MTAPARTKRKANSPGSGALSSAFTIESAATCSKPTRTNARGGKITAASRTARNGVGSSVPLSGAVRAPAGPAIGTGSTRYD
jgi:hypothetical protein